MKVYITIVEIEDSASETRRLGIGGWSILSNISDVLFTPVVKWHLWQMEKSRTLLPIAHLHICSLTVILRKM